MVCRMFDAPLPSFATLSYIDKEFIPLSFHLYEWTHITLVHMPRKLPRLFKGRGQTIEVKEWGMSKVKLIPHPLLSASTEGLNCLIDLNPIEWKVACWLLQHTVCAQYAQSNLMYWHCLMTHNHWFIYLSVGWTSMEQAQAHSPFLSFLCESSD